MTTRRTFLRSAFGGAVFTLHLPLLDCFLNSNGTAMAATGAALPIRFGTWWQGLGFTPGRWIPKTTGANYENNAELKIFDPFRHKMNLISGTQYFLDGRPLETHLTGYQIASMGAIPTGVNSGPSLDSQIADVIGAHTRFRSLEISMDGGKQSFSKRAGSAYNPGEPSPIALYERLFGPEFKDPNAAEFTPDTAVVARKSVLSYLAEERASVMGQLGASDKARMDQYFTSIREIEQQLDIQMQKPEPMPACTIPEKPAEVSNGKTIVEIGQRAKLMGKLLAHALVCDQTRVFNISLGSNSAHKAGTSQTWHELTHEEAIDDKLGYQPEVAEFIAYANDIFAAFLGQLDGMREGDGTLLDRSLVLWQTDHGYARTHTIDALPILTAGRAGGKIKTGIHVAAPGDPATRVGLTIQQALGVPVGSWGALSNQTSKTVTEIVA